MRRNKIMTTNLSADAIAEIRSDWLHRFACYTDSLAPTKRISNQFLSRFCDFNAYELFIPTTYDGTAMPLVVMLHGSGQSSKDFARGTRMNEVAEELGFLVVYPEQSSFANASTSWNWFRKADQIRGSGEPAQIVAILAHVARDFAVVKSAVFVAGFSSGAAMAVIMGVTYPDVFTAVGAHSGLPYHAATNFFAASAVMFRGPGNRNIDHPEVAASQRAVPTIVFHGDADTTVNGDNGQQIFDSGRHNTGLDESVTHHSVGESGSGVGYSRHVMTCQKGVARFELWTLQNTGHTWSGGSSRGSHTAQSGPNASREMIRFFFEQVSYDEQA
jgi:poly(hydroxyalkanoate) depolymerase family esterase